MSTTGGKATVASSRTKKTKSVAVAAPNKPKKTTVTKKSAATKKSPSKKPTKKQATKKSTPTKAKTKTVEQVQLPSNMSQRAITKSLTFKAYYKRLLPYAVIAVAAVCIVSGSAIALYSSLNPQAEAQMASLCLAGTCATQTGEVAIDNNSQKTTPTVRLGDTLPSEISTDTQLKLQTTNTKNLTVSIEDVNGVLTVLPTTALSNDLYSVTIPGDTLSPSRYIVHALAFATNNSRSAVILGTFIVPSKTQKTEISNASTTAASSTTSAHVDEEVIPTTAEAITITTKTTTLTERTPVFFVVDADYSFIELYARRSDGLAPQFLGLANKYDNIWSYVIEPNNLPAGTYAIYAKSMTAEQTPVLSNVLSLTVPSTATLFETPQASTSTTVPGQFVAIIPPTDQPNIKEETAALMKLYETEIQSLLGQYGTAVRAGNDVLVSESAKALTDLRSNMLFSLYQQGASDAVVSQVSEELTYAMTALENKVVTFEQLQAKRNNTDTTDTDGDGVTDVDERLLYGTDPESADTDQDGFTDGIEIIRGFNPLDADAETVITYALPTNTVANVQSDILKIASVTPQVATDNTTDTSHVQSVITGQALPNAYVTLYIFSSPTIVTVRTDADGAFEYTLTKELTDGSHEVYVALTDNTGEIVARSAPFGFTKEAEIYTPTPIETTPVLRQPEFMVASSHVYVTTLGVVVLAFGLLLLLVGFGINRNRSIVITNATS